MLIQGSADPTILAEQTAGFAAKQVACESIILQGAGHRLTEWDNFDPGYKLRMIEWLQCQLTATR